MRARIESSISRAMKMRMKDRSQQPISHQLSSQHIQGHRRSKPAYAFTIPREISLNHFGTATVRHRVKYQADGLLGCASAGTRHAGDAHSERRLAAIPYAFSQGCGHFTADRAVPLDHLGGDACKLRLELVRINDSSAEKIPRAAADRRDALSKHPARTGFCYSQRGIAHLHPVAHDLFERFAISRVNEIIQFVLDLAGYFVNSCLRGLSGFGARGEVQFNLSSSSQNCGVHVSMSFVNRSDASVDLGFPEHRDFQHASREKRRRNLRAEPLPDLRLEQSLQLVWWSGQKHDDALAIVKLPTQPLSRGGAIPILDS